MNGDHLAKVAINDIERNRDAMGNVNKSSLVIHSVARVSCKLNYLINKVLICVFLQQPSTRLVKVCFIELCFITFF